MSKHRTILRIDTSGRYTGSVTRQLADQLVTKLQSLHKEAKVVVRDVARGLPLLDQVMIDGFYLPEIERTGEQIEALQLSDALVKEFEAANILVVSLPIYNFSVPASLKVYIDLVCRTGLTFRYTEAGPVPLLRSRPTYVIVTSDGTPFRSSIDYASDYFAHILGFLGIKEYDITFIVADRLSFEKDKVQEVQSQIARLS